MASKAKNTENSPSEANTETPKKTRAKKAAAAPESPELTGVVVAPSVEIRILSPEEYEAALQEKINGEIKRFNIAEAGIEELKEKYADLQIPEVTDKAGIKLVKEALSEVSGVVKAIEDKRVLIKADYLKTGRAIDAEAARLTALIEPLKLEIKAKKEAIDAAEKAEKERKEKEEADKLNKRVDEINDAGMKFDGSFYVIGNMSMDISTLKALKDSDFQFLLAKVRIEAERIEKEQAERDRIEAERLESERQERLKFEEEQAAFKKQQEEFKRQQDEFAAKQKQLEEAERKRQEEIAAENKRREDEEKARQQEIRQERIKKRGTILEALGMTYVTSQGEFVFQNEAGRVAYANPLLDTTEEEHFQDAVSRFNNQITDLKNQQEEIDATRKEEAAEKAREEERQRLEQERIEKEKAAELERKAEAEKLARLPELERLFHYIMELVNVPAPELTDPVAQGVINHIYYTLDETRQEVAKELQKDKLPAGE